MKNRFIAYVVSIILFSLCFGDEVAEQDGINISGGFGFPEVLNVGLRIQSGQVQLGISIGSIPIEGEWPLSVSGDLYVHFGGQSEFSIQRLWYGRIGIDYLRTESDYVLTKHLLLNLRLGKTVNISRKIGINADLGAVIQLTHEEIRKKPPSGWFNFSFDFPILPSGGIGLFYRI